MCALRHVDQHQAVGAVGEVKHPNSRQDLFEKRIFDSEISAGEQLGLGIIELQQWKWWHAQHQEGSQWRAALAAVPLIIIIIIIIKQEGNNGNLVSKSSSGIVNEDPVAGDGVVFEQGCFVATLPAEEVGMQLLVTGPNLAKRERESFQHYL